MIAALEIRPLGTAGEHLDLVIPEIRRGVAARGIVGLKPVVAGKIEQ